MAPAHSFVTSWVLDSNIPLKCQVYCSGFGKALLQHRVIVNMHEDKLPGVGWGQEGWKKCFNHSTRHACAPNQLNSSLAL